VGFFYISDDPAPERGACDPDVVVLIAGGEIDYAAAPQLKERMARHIEAGTRRMVLDFSQVTFIDSTAIGVLIGTGTRLQRTGKGSLTVICGKENTRVLRIIDISGIDSLFELEYSREDAFSALATAG
jgi:anti-sigma B factor antagonist